MRTKERSAQAGVRDMDRALACFEEAFQQARFGKLISMGGMHEPSDPRSAYDPLNCFRLVDRDETERLMQLAIETLEALTALVNRAIDGE